MQKVVFDDPYEFVPPYRKKLWSWAFRFYLPRYLRKTHGVTGWTTHGLEHLRKSLNSGHGVILCPNHCRPADPMLSGVITAETPCHVFALASWHVFKQGWLESFIARRVGAFSIYREGLDRKALDTSIDIVAKAERPLIIFPEGVISAANDRLHPLMEGTSFVARTAAKKRSKTNPDSRVVIHPVSFRYRHQCDPEQALRPILDDLERIVFWNIQDELPLIERVRKLASAVLSVHEIECVDRTGTGSRHERARRLINDILQPLEQEWLSTTRTGDVIGRVKDLRSAIVVDMVKGTIDDRERKRRWRQLTQLYYAQCLSLFPEGYLDEGRFGDVTPDRIFETVERLEEVMTDTTRVREVLHVDITVGEPLEVDPNVRRTRGSDPLMTELRQRMLGLLGVEDWWPPESITEVKSPAQIPIA